MKKAVTQEQMAAALNISPQAISKWENDLTLPDITLLPELSIYLGVTIDELFDLTDERHLDRIRNMIILQETFNDRDFAYAEDFLLHRLTDPVHAQTCLELLPALYNHKADEYRRKAEYYAKEALERFPENHTNHANLSDSQQGSCGDWNLDNRADRIQYYKEFVQKNPDSVEGLKWYITELLSVGRCREASDAIEQISRLYTARCTNDPESEYSFCRPDIYRAKLLWEQGEHEQALKRFDALTAAHPDDWKVWNFAGDTFAKACLYDKAIACYEHTLSIQPKPRYVDAPMAIAQICEITGDISGAISAWKTYIRILNEDWNTVEGVCIDKAKHRILELETKQQ